MSSFSIKPAAASSKIQELQKCGNELYSIRESVRSICENLSIESGSRPMLKSKLTKISNDIYMEMAVTRYLSGALAASIQLYEQADRETQIVEGGTEDTLNNGTGTGEVPFSAESGKNDEQNPFVEAFNTIDEYITWIFEAFEIVSAGGSDAEFFEKLLKYPKAFLDFFFGDKSGIDGLLNLGHLMQYSAEFWKVLYDTVYGYFKIRNMSGGFFTEYWSSYTSVFALFGSLIEFGTDAIENFRDYIGKNDAETLKNLLQNPDKVLADIFRMFDSTAELGGDLYYLSEGATGVEAIALAIKIQYIKAFAAGLGNAAAQYIESRQKYSEDGTYDMKDQSEAVIDTYVEGGLSFAETLWFDADVKLYNFLCERQGLPTVEPEEYRDMVGERTKDLLRKVGHWIFG